MKRYDQLLEEIQVLIITNEVEMQKKQINNEGYAGSGPPIILGGQRVDEKEFEDENLCTICCFQKQDTIFVPCEHQTCKMCIQTHMLNSEKCPFCNAEIKELKEIK